MLRSTFLIVLFLSITFTQRSYAQDRAAIASHWLETLGVKATLVVHDPSGDQREQFVRAIQLWAKGTAEPAKITVGTLPFQSLSSTTGERILLVPQVKYEWTQTPRYVYGVPYGSASGTANSFFPNPDSSLSSFGGTFTLSQAFLSISDRTTACMAADDARTNNNIDVKGDDYCHHYKFISGSRPPDYLQRVLSAISVTDTASQNPRFQSSLVPIDVSSTPVSHFSLSNSVTGTFDPSKLYRTATDWKNILKTMDAYSLWTTDKENLDGNLCDQITDACLRRYAYGWQKVRVVEALLPRIDVKASTPFNYQASALNTLIQPPPGSYKVLYDVTLTLDLTKLIPNSGTRSDAEAVIAAIAAKNKKANAPPAPVDPNAAWRMQVAAMYIELAYDSTVINDATWWSVFRTIVLNIH